jgi:chromosome segregation ATPase
MKKTIVFLAVAVFIASTVFSACKTKAEKLRIAQENVKDAKQNLLNEKMDSIAEYEQFKIENEKKLAANEKSIKEFKLRIAKEKAENRASYEKKINELEQKNSDLKKNLEDYKEDSKEKWAAFKFKFSQDMDNLGVAIKNFTK